jgi:malonyl-CoA decarboxylase
MPDEPLIFVEVALTSDVPGSVDQLLSDDRVPLSAQEARVAVFYSISNCQVGLRGISFGNLLIKQVVAELSLELANLEQFVTLSPIPKLNAWLKTQLDDAELGAAARQALAGQSDPESLKRFAARYLVTGKGKDGLPFDPVARFHLGNGAEIHAVHANADLSENGQSQSCGVMVNYHYDLTKTEQHHEDFAHSAVIAATKDGQILARADLSLNTKEKIA